MTDDIVTRLRGKTPIQTRPCIRGGCCEICESILDSAHEAADEIERLRKILIHICDVWKSDLYSITNEISEIEKGLRHG